MIRIIIAAVKVVLAFFLALLFQNCSFDKFVIKGSGKIVRETRACETAVTGISVENGINVKLLQGKDSKITVAADDNIINHIQTTCRGTTLHISKSAKIFLKDETIEVTVQLPLIERIETTTAAQVKSSQVITTRQLTIEASTGSEVEISTEAAEIIADANTGSTIILNGKALTIELTAATGSTFNAEKLIANDIWSTAHSGATVYVHPLVSLDAEATTGGVLHYAGNPKKIKKLEHTGGSISVD